MQYEGNWGFIISSADILFVVFCTLAVLASRSHPNALFGSLNSSL